MENIEPIETRRKMVKMHQFFLDKIIKATEEKNYLEAAWLIYSCLENRYFRTIKKYNRLCKYGKNSCKKNSNEIALKTKIRCVERLMKSNKTCLSNAFTKELIDRTITWVKKRNKLMHQLLTLDTYEESYNESFKELAIEGQQIVIDTYSACTTFRKDFFKANYEFVFPNECMDKCPCNNKKGE